jgi:hypothetical protein
MKNILHTILAAAALAICGCASTAENLNQAARELGRPAGSAARLPGSFMEGAAEGVAGQPTANPYGR